jgi:death-on-curing protein
MNHEFLTMEEVAAMHDVLIRESGGAFGLRDEGALASALIRPQIGYYNGLIEEAAAMMESLAMNHPFIDGNKRVAFAATDAFLRMNGHFIDCDDEEAYAFFMHLFETGNFRFAQLNSWLEEHVQQL